MSSIKIRGYTEHDLDALKKLHARQGFDYPCPDLSNPLFVSKLVVEVADPSATTAEHCKAGGNAGRGVLGAADTDMSGGAVSNSDTVGNRTVVMAALARLTCEIYLLADSEAGTPLDRYIRLLALHRAAEDDLRARGLEDAHAWLPPRIARRFGHRLEALGWLRDDAWTPYCRRL